MTFKIGDRVEWTSQAAGITRTKVGEVVEVVPANRPPETHIKDRGWYRNHESYVVRAVAQGLKSNARSKTYWPRASALRVSP